VSGAHLIAEGVRLVVSFPHIYLVPIASMGLTKPYLNSFGAELYWESNNRGLSNLVCLVRSTVFLKVASAYHKAVLH
jgi:hypothetical protein